MPNPPVLLTKLMVPATQSRPLLDETTVTKALKYTKRGRVDGVMHYYSAEMSACVPFPNSFPLIGSGAYMPPADQTMTTILASLDNDGTGPTGFVEVRRNTYSTDNFVTKKFSPSTHSRWLIEPWRLWEGNWACAARQNLMKRQIELHKAQVNW